ncbi:PREDICTED: INO80 complex subunit E-like isoform X2 [Priapulus caudatus]|nr:PREDICTED: INO80 complex subunit E-like isoform X2 [Priapulus caudatus]
MRKSQRRLLRISRDKSFLLDRLLQYEKVGDSSSESDDTASSSSEPEKGTKVAKRKKTLSISHSLAPPLGTTDPMAALAALGYPGLSKPGGKLSSGKTGEPHKKKPKSSSKSSTQPGQSTTKSPVQRAKPHKMSTEDIHRHLQAKKLIVDTETIPTSVPQEMFSTTPDEIAAEPSPAPQPEDNDQLIIDIPE